MKSLIKTMGSLILILLIMGISVLIFLMFLLIGGVDINLFRHGILFLVFTMSLVIICGLLYEMIFDCNISLNIILGREKHEKENKK